MQVKTSSLIDGGYLSATHYYFITDDSRIMYRAIVLPNKDGLALLIEKKALYKPDDFNHIGSQDFPNVPNADIIIDSIKFFEDGLVSH